MQKESEQIKITETDTGLRVDITGVKFKDLFSGCCLPSVCICPGEKNDCCNSEDKKAES